MLVRMYGVSRHCRSARRLVKNCTQFSSSSCEMHEPYRKIIGNREIVGFGYNNEPSYIDCEDFPFPAIRYKECTPEIMALREKERGDWKNLTIEEKKCLYRASFRQTFAEINAPSSDWKLCIGVVLISCTLSLWVHLWIRHFVQKDWPQSFSPESRIAQYYRMVAINAAPFKTIPVPPGAEKRVHPKNRKMLEEQEEEEKKKEKNKSLRADYGE